MKAAEVHSWCVRLDVPPEALAGLYATLSQDERNRSARFRFARDRQRFIAARGALRALLGRYLRARPGEIRFAYTAFGKPELSPEFGSRLKFNLSHSADVALIAVAADADVGVDLEYIRSHSDYGTIAQCFLSAVEVDHLNRVPSHLYAQAFLSCWTKKEAYVKARGEGLVSSLPSFSVPQLDGAWSLYSLQPAPGYIGALAVAGRSWRVRQWHWHASVERLICSV